MKKIICFLFGGFAVFNMLVIFPALMSNAPAGWITERIICAIIFGGISYLLARKRKTQQEESTMVAYANEKQENKDAAEEVEKLKEKSKEESLFSSPESEAKAKSLFKIASDSISEIINVSGSLSKKGLCEAIIFNSNIILNDPVFKQKSYCKIVSDEYLILLYFLIREQKGDLNEDKLASFINERLEFYSSEYNKLVNDKQYSSMYCYSTFYITPLEDEPKPSLDVLKVMTFQVGLIRMACKVHELLDIKIKSL